jgi:hypothetical protein
MHQRKTIDKLYTKLNSKLDELWTAAYKTPGTWGRNKHNNKRISSTPLDSIKDFKSHKYKTRLRINQSTGTQIST